jgi:hypothetical protein
VARALLKARRVHDDVFSGKVPMNTTRILVSSLALVSALGCSKSTPAEQKKMEDDLAAAFASAMASASAAPAAPAKPIAFETKAQDKLGVTISIPAGSKVVSDDAFGTSYSYMVDPLDEFAVSLASAVGVTSLKTAVDDASLAPQPIADKKEVDKTTFQVVKASMGGTVFVYEYKKVKKGWVKATCDGPEAYKDKLVQACSSLASR